MPITPEVNYKKKRMRPKSGSTKVRLHLSHGAFKKPYRRIRRHFKSMPRYGDAFLARGLAYMASGDNQQAMKDISKTIQLNLKDAVACNNRTGLYHERGDYQNALNDFSRAIQPNSVVAKKAYYNRGLSYAELGDHQKAAKDLSRAIELNPRNADAYYNRAVMYGKVGDRKKG